MILTVNELSTGTPEQTWLSSRLVQCPTMTWEPIDEGQSARAVVVAPHPDDEVLGAGGAMIALAAAGYKIEIVAVSDGEASHPRSTRVTRGEMIERRAHERELALERLGVHVERITRLSIPDGKVSAAHDLPERLSDLVAGAALCIAPWSSDGHPDHDASGAAAALACSINDVRVVQYPIWAWHWAHPNAADFPWSRVHRFDLSAEMMRAKRSAIAEYRSQTSRLGPDPVDDVILPSFVLRRFSRPFETFFL